MLKCRRVYILEGADGSGKSTLLSKLSGLIGPVICSHHGPYTGMNGKAMARAYVDSMLPALLGEANVILDRSWLSEPIYGNAFRGGIDRIGPVLRRQLERLAMRCGAQVIHCDPGYSICLEAWAKRKGKEYLKTADQLAKVVDGYAHMATDLPVYRYSYMTDSPTSLLSLPPKAHNLDVRTAGNWEAKVVLVGEDFAALKPEDHHYQWPFGSFSGQGCSQWLTQVLEDEGIKERQLLWVNSDQDLGWLSLYCQDFGASVVALGQTATAKLAERSIRHQSVDHPQWRKRFMYGLPYDLTSIIKELL